VDIFEHLESEHRQVEGMFEQLISKGRDEKLFNDFAMSLAAHVKAEEEVLYTRLEADKATRERIMEAYVEHQVAGGLLGEIMGTRDAEQFRARMSVLEEMVGHHIQEEEQNLFPQVRGSIIPLDEARQLDEKYEQAENRQLESMKKQAA
jgi:hemerythrin superfamily protein